MALKLNPYAHQLILVGLMSVMWDMRRRDETSLGFSSLSSPWQDRLTTAYDSWHASFCGLFCDADPRFVVCTLGMYHSAHVALVTPLLDLQIYAGAHKILGKLVQKADYERSRRSIKAWVKTPDAGKACWHAAKLLQVGWRGTGGEWDVGGRFVYPWCMYLAALVGWGYCFAMVPAPGAADSSHEGEDDEGEDDEDDGMVWDAIAEMEAFVDGMVEIPRDDCERREREVRAGAKTTGLVAVVGKHLETVRWALVREGCKVLRGLIQGRLVRGFEQG